MKSVLWLKNILDAFNIGLPNSDQVQSWVRSSLTGIGVLAVQYGWGSSQTWVWVTGLCVAVTPFVWGAFVHSYNAQFARLKALPDSTKIAAVEDIPGVKSIIIKPSASSELQAIVNNDTRPKVRGF